MEVQEVSVWVCVYGDYCAFHEMGISVVYDITNDIQLDDMSLEELNEFEFEGDYSDYEVRSALKVGDEYYIKF